MGRRIPAALVLLASLAAHGQYPGQVSRNNKENPELRAIAVLEWTGDPGKPKTSRLVPVAVLDGGQLQDGGIYLARPEPLSLAGEVEYEIEKDGRPQGLFDVENAGHEQGSWVGYGSWKPLPAPKPKPSPKDLAKADFDDVQSDDKPILHRKHHADESPAGGNASGSKTDSSAPPPAADPDRPTLHKKDPGNSTDTADKSSTQAAGADPDRPVLKRSKKKDQEDIGHSDALPDVTDPDRPRLKRGKSEGYTLDVVPSLMGLPPDMQQTVAVSDARTIPEHPWDYTWADPGDEARMKAALEDIARSALGLNPAPPPATSKTAPKRNPTRKNAQPAPPPPPPAPLVDEQFRVFELAYGSGATLVLSAHTDGPPAQQKFVTLIAQPDLYGNVLVLSKNVTDGAHLDETPRMRLVDAVDALADNRGELLFELRGATQRQFALYRVMRGQAEKLFVSGGEFASE